MKYKHVIDFIRSLYPNKDFIPLHEPYFGGNEKKYLNECIDSTFVSSVGKFVDRFEEMMRDFTGAKYAVATVNGTSALHVALKLAGVQQNDLVITQPLTFVATCNAISYCGADSVFIDIDRDTLGLSPDALGTWLENNTIIEDDSCYYLPRIDANSGLKKISACVPMHSFGHPCKVDQIVEICNRYHIPIVEDSAESLGSYYKEQHTGTFGKLGVLSFNGNKTITTGGGGMILTDDDELGPLAKHITTTAKKPHPWKFEHDIVAYNYRMPNVNAAIGCAQMEQLDEILANKRETARSYEEFFKNNNKVEYVAEPKDTISNYWLNAILLEDYNERELFLKETNENKVMTRPAWMLMNELEMFKDSIAGDLKVSRNVSDRLVNIPSSVNL
jgi:aminotransferase in exopolysaccharide biosynthesis